MVTIVDVARHAGVAPSTVSYALTGKRSISIDTRSRVQESVQALGYHHRPVRTAARGRANVLGLLLPPHSGLNLTAETRFVMSAIAHASRHAMDVLIGPTVERLCGSQEVDGFLVVDANADRCRDEVLRHTAKPCVFVGRSTSPRRSLFVDVDLDFEAVGALCVDHLAAQGHRYIGFLGLPNGFYRSSTFAHRVMSGFTAAAMRRGIVSTSVPAGEGHESVLRTAIALMRIHPLMTALVVQNEAAAGSVAASLRVAERQVSRKTAVVAICTAKVGDVMPALLTTVHLPLQELAERAVDLLVGLVDEDPIFQDSRV